MGILILVCVLAVILIFVGLFMMEHRSELIGCVGFLVSTFSSGIAIICLVFMPFYCGASIKADLVNKEFGTDYTAEQVFYAESIIDEIREVKRQRIEINGDLLRGEK